MDKICNDTLKEMQNIDVRTVEADSLVSLEQIRVPENLPKEDRLGSFYRQIKNPYCFKAGKVIVKLCYSREGPTIEECLKEYIRQVVP